MEAQLNFPKENFIETALQCGEAIWYRGLLYKGNGICHGITGNAYSFLALYRYTDDESWLNRAFMFAQLSMNPQVADAVSKQHTGRKVGNIPDMPYSLYEGKGGDICFYLDLMQNDPKLARFPGFEL